MWSPCIILLLTLPYQLSKPQFQFTDIISTLLRAPKTSSLDRGLEVPEDCENDIACVETLTNDGSHNVPPTKIDESVKNNSLESRSLQDIVENALKSIFEKVLQIVMNFNAEKILIVVGNNFGIFGLSVGQLAKNSVQLGTNLKDQGEILADLWEHLGGSAGSARGARGDTLKKFGDNLDNIEITLRTLSGNLARLMGDLGVP